MRKLSLSLSLGLGVALLTALIAYRLPAADLPESRPSSVTEVVVCPSGREQILVVVLTYPDGTVLRFDADHMHGFTVDQLLQYALTAKDKWTESEKCGVTT